ncbi:MAG: hypothetical protein H7A21_05985 [Spirochaetales bacterium]|nr:hypothetical protein [Leptospiraceae bacterium]MCP5480960.1 hypothetical protein [Spirochaetales bacterium]MCP5485340.1 hypothetical protein [Spirochaetales bacterium]
MCRRTLILGFLLPVLALAAVGPTAAQTANTRGLPDPYYPQQPQGQLRLNYYYDRSGQWVKFSDWIPFRQNQYEPRFLEDFYQLYGLPHHYNVPEVKESIYFLVQSLTHRFRHPRDALCKIETEEQYHKYRLLMHMHINLLIMRMYLRLGSLFDKRHLYFHDLDVADDLEVSFLIARTYYNEARTYWAQAVRYAGQAADYRFELDLPQIETERYQIMTGRLNFDRIIERHLYQVEAKLGVTTEFLDREGRPRPVRQLMQDDMEAFHNEAPSPLSPPVLNPHWQEQPLFPNDEQVPIFEDETASENVQ